MIFAHFLLTEVNEANTYVVGCPETKEALLVDAAAWDPRIPRFLEAHDLTLSAVFITHDHYDHTGGLKDAVEATGAAAYSGGTQAGGVPTRQVRHGDVVNFGNVDAKVIATPGHTPNGLSLIVRDRVFTGDALFAGSVGGTTSPRNARQQADHIREHIFPLPDEFEIHPGHGPSSTVAIERQFNPFFV